MLIKTEAQYNDIPDGTVLKIVLLGDDWEDDTGTINDCLKFGDKLYDTPSSYYLFSERNDKTTTEDYSFVVIKTPGKQYEI